MPLDPFDRSTMPPHVVGAREIFGEQAVPVSRRKQILGLSGLKATLLMISGLFAELDFSVTDQRWGEVEEAWCRSLEGDLGQKIRAEVRRGNLMLSQAGMLQCIKEAIQYAHAQRDEPISNEDFALCILGANTDIELSGLGSPTSWDELESAMVLFHSAAASMNHNDTIQTLSTTAEATWLRSWPEDLQGSALIEDLGSGPAAVFADVMQIGIEDFWTIGWIIFNLCRTEKTVAFTEDTLREQGLTDKHVKAFRKNCVATIDRHRLILDRVGSAADTNPWTRFHLQQTPFVKLDDGTIVVVRLQSVVQRFFGDHPFLQVDHILRKTNATKHSHFEGAMKHMFELRVGEVLKKIRRVTRYRRSVAIFAEPDMKAAWSDSRGQHPQLCDWAFATNDHCLLLDANSRLLKQAFAEGTATIEEFDQDLEFMYSDGKFHQLMSAVHELHDRGWKQGPVKIGENTQFIPLVVVPDDGLPSTELIENRMFRAAMEMTRPYAGLSLPPGIIRWRELLILEGLVEIREVDIFQLLVMWRLAPRLISTLPLPFTKYLEDFTPLDQPMPRRLQKSMREFSLKMTRRANELKRTA